MRRCPAPLAIALLFPSLGVGRGPVSPFNGRPIAPPDSTGAYRFVVSGHFYGSNTARSGFMASTLLANLDTINALGASFMLTTGDLFIDPLGDRDRARRSFFSRLHLPLFNAVGNHDLGGGHYPELYGATFFSFDVGPDRFIILDTERDDSGVRGDQLAMIEHAAADAATGSIRALFIISHRPIWAEGADRYEGLFSNNTRSLTGGNYAADVLPLLRRIAATTPVTWFSGSLGGQASASFFIDRPEQGLTFIQTAIRDEKRDALLLVDVSTDGARFSGFSLTGTKLAPVEAYDLAWWRKHGLLPTFNWKLLPWHIRSIVTHRAFWAGVGATAFVALLIAWYRRRRR